MATSVPLVKDGIARLPARGMSTPAPQSAFFRDNRSPFLLNWNPALRENSEDVRQSWQLAAARTSESIQNNGIVAGIVDTSTAGVVGPAMALAMAPNAKALGWKDKTTDKWVDDCETAFAAWANDPKRCDAGARMNFGHMQQLAYKSWFAFGEIVALTPMIRRPGVTGQTKILMLPPSRLSQRSSGFDRVYQGVKIDAFTAPISYFFEKKNEYGFKDEYEIRATDSDGRRNVIHVFDPTLGGVRGISPLVSVLLRTRQFDQTWDATITTTLLQTIFGATITSSLTGDAAMEGLYLGAKGDFDCEAFADRKADWYDSAKIDLSAHGRIAHLYPNDKLEFHEAKHPSETVDIMLSWLLREVAAAAGVMYESATGDYRGATYSSIRMGSAIEWNKVDVRRENIVAPFSNAAFDAVIEEEVGEGRLKYPGGFDQFLAERHLSTLRYWSGPPKPQADDLKTARAQETNKNIGVATLQSMSSENGYDWKRQADQKQRERVYYKKLGLPDPYPDEAKLALALAKTKKNADGGDPKDNAAENE